MSAALLLNLDYATMEALEAEVVRRNAAADTEMQRINLALHAKEADKLYKVPDTPAGLKAEAAAAKKLGCAVSFYRIGEINRLRREAIGDMTYNEAIEALKRIQSQPRRKHTKTSVAREVLSEALRVIKEMDNAKTA